MTILLYLSGLAIGITAFLYVTQAMQSGKDKLEGKTKPNVKKKRSKNTTNSDNIVIQNQKPVKVPPGTRMCPICRSYLEKWEPLYSSKTKKSTEEKILIHGCRYCYKEDE